MLALQPLVLIFCHIHVCICRAHVLFPFLTTITLTNSNIRVIITSFCVVINVCGSRTEATKGLIGYP